MVADTMREPNRPNPSAKKQDKSLAFLVAPSSVLSLLSDRLYELRVREIPRLSIAFFFLHQGVECLCYQPRYLVKMSWQG